MFTVLGVLSKFAVLDSVTCTTTTIEGEEEFQRCLMALDSETHTYIYILKQRDHPISCPRAYDPTNYLNCPYYTMLSTSGSSHYSVSPRSMVVFAIGIGDLLSALCS